MGHSPESGTFKVACRIHVRGRVSIISVLKGETNQLPDSLFHEFLSIPTIDPTGGPLPVPCSSEQKPGLG